ncbi:hypothetical protein P170DRAFT_289602 [Aspergillus steynii IBT 23096]|uniref:Uncharacterized protein n=1 Tax=Aspergillus steynii IBT 23096 TaxID=1392250 RepID=A0A2I2FVF4_9EURO|nr:uncharacterized protein P170DRAFT_289602 [Aspergillus steynii IBT 23096]PLB44628.1 hypothetical protein P170DRAFT_289602 [Aspergillus steynii IBT 23096]
MNMRRMKRWHEGSTGHDPRRSIGRPAHSIPKCPPSVEGAHCALSAFPLGNPCGRFILVGRRIHGGTKTPRCFPRIGRWAATDVRREESQKWSRTRLVEPRD